MAYSSKVVQKVLSNFESKEKAAVYEAEKRKAALYKKLPELREIDERLANTHKEIIGSVLNPGEDIKIKLENIKNKNKDLQEQRKRILEQNKYAEDYTDPVYECKNCGDTGYTGDKISREMCGCLKRALAAESAEDSGFGGIIKSQSFDNFNLDYYDKKKAKDTKINESPYKHMSTVLKECRAFAERFGEPDSVKNVIFMGRAGLGKTHLSSAIASEVIKKGYDVYYDSAQNILYSFEKGRFSRQDVSNSELIERYMTCDLLIIDDLGTEYSGNMSVASLYSLINMRMTKDKGIIISTNLSMDDMRARYDERIVSRIFGEFSLLLFAGDDVRYKRRDI